MKLRGLKATTLLLVITMMLTVLVACGGSEEDATTYEPLMSNKPQLSNKIKQAYTDVLVDNKLNTSKGSTLQANRTGVVLKY